MGVGMNALMLGLWCAAAAGAPPAPPLPQEPVAIAVMMFSAPDAALASVVTARAAQSIRALGVFQVVDPEMAMGLLRAEAARELTGCTDASCLAELAGLVGAAQLVSGSVTRTADVYQVHVVLIDQRTTTVMDGVVVTVKELRDVGNAVDGAHGHAMTNSTRAL